MSEGTRSGIAKRVKLDDKGRVLRATVYSSLHDDEPIGNFGITDSDRVRSGASVEVRFAPGGRTLHLPDGTNVGFEIRE